MRSMRAPLVCLLMLVSSVAISPAVLAGDFTSNGTQPGLEFGLRAPSTCRFCHTDAPATVEQIQPYPNWVGSMMANSSRDPLFWAALDVAEDDIPGIGDWCMRCHVPHGWLDGRSEPPGGTTDGCALEGQIDRTNNDFDGVSCQLCHRIQVNEDPPPGQQELYLDNAQWWIDDEACGGANEPCRAGPYDYTDGAAPPPHPWKYSELHESSEMCSHCHMVTHPVNTLIIDGRDTEVPFPIERTYREWSRSAYGDEFSEHYTPCQGCHMPDATANPSFACIFEINDRQGDMPIHQFVGGNAWVPRILAGEYPSLGYSQALMRTADLAEANLQQQSAAIKVAVSPPRDGDGPLLARVQVTNLTGHKLPTGYLEGRRMWLHVEAFDGTGTPIFESGAYDELTGVLTHDEQIKVYEAKYGTWDREARECRVKDDQGREEFHFVLNDCVVKDNRIPPLGTDPKFDIETRQVGYSYPTTFDGRALVNHDVTTYAIDVPSGAESPIQVVATLKYQTSSKEYVDFLYNTAVENDFPDDCIERSTGPLEMSRGEYLKDVWERYDRSPPVDMVAAADSLDLDAVASGGAQGPGGIGGVEGPDGPGHPGRPNGAGAATFLRVEAFDAEAGLVDVIYDASRGSRDQTAHWGSLDRVADLAISRSECGLGTGGFTQLRAGAGSEFFLLVDAERPERISVDGKVSALRVPGCRAEGPQIGTEVAPPPLVRTTSTLESLR